MSLEYSRSALKVTVAQICQNLGWNSIHATPLELLTDVLERYLLQLSRLSHRYSEQFGLTDPRLEDVGLALSHMGVNLSELEDYISHVDPTPFPKEVVAFPAPRQNDLKFPNPESKEVQQRKVFEFVPEHLPYMHPELNEDTEDSNPAAPASPDRLQVEQLPITAELSPGVGEKRPSPSPGDSNMPFKRPRMPAPHLPDEASHSQYEITSVVMTHSGILSPVRQGKIPDSRTPKQIVIVKSSSSGAQPRLGGEVLHGGSQLNPETPIIKLDFSKDPAGQTKIVEVGAGSGNGMQVNLDRGDPEFLLKKKKDRKKVEKVFNIKRGPGRPRSPGRAHPVIHKKSTQDVCKLLTLPRKDDSLGKPGTLEPPGPMDLTVKPTPTPLNISVKLDDSLKSKSEPKQKIVVISKEQEKDMEDTIASVIQQSAREPDIFNDERANHPPPVIFRENGSHEKSIKKESDPKQEDVWRVSSITEVDTDENAHDSFETDEEKGDNLLSPPKSLYMAPHLRLLQSSSGVTPPKKRGRPRGSTSSLHRGSLVRGRARGRPPLNRSPVGSSPGRPPLNRSPGRPPLNRSPGRPSGSGRSPGRPKGSLNKHHSPKPRGRPRGSKSPRSRGGSPRGMSPRGAIQNINFDVNLSDIVKPEKEDSNDSEATNFEFPTQSPESDTDKKSFELDDETNRFDLAGSEPSSPAVKHTPANSPVPSPKSDVHESSPVEDLPISETIVRKEITPEPPTAEKHDLKRGPSAELSDRDLKDSEEDSRKTTNYGEIDSQSRVSEERESSSERAFNHHFHKERSWDREKRDSSREMDIKDLSDRDRNKENEDRVYSKENEIVGKQFDQDEREMSVDRVSVDRDRKDISIERDYRSLSRENEYRERSREKEHSREREHKEHRKDREHNKDKDHKVHSKEREHKERSMEKEQRDHKKDRDHKGHSKEKDVKERSLEKEHKDYSKDRELKEYSLEREPKEHSKESDHKEHRRDKEHKKDKKKKKKKDKDKDRERDKDEKKEKRDREEKKDKRDREEKKEKRDRDEKKEKRDKDDKREKRDKDEKREKKEKHKSKENREDTSSAPPLVQRLKIKIGGGTSSSPSSFSVSAAPIRPSPVRESQSPVHRPEIPKLKFKVLPPKPDSEKDRKTDPQHQSWTSSVKQEVEKMPTPKYESQVSSPERTSIKSEPIDDDSGEDSSKGNEDTNLNISEDAEVERVVTVSVIKGKITGIGGAKKPGKRGKRKGSFKKGKPKIPKLAAPSPAVSPAITTKVLSVKKVLDKASSESPSHLFSAENVPSPITIPALKAAPPPPSPPASKKSPPKPKPLLKEKEMRAPSPLVKETVPKSKPPPVTIPKAAKISKSPRRSSPRKSPKFSPPSKKKGGPLSTPSSKSPSSKPTSPSKSIPFDFTVPRTPSPSPLSTPSHSPDHSSPMYSPASSPSRDSLSFNIPPTPALPTRITSPVPSPPSRQISTDDEKEATPPVDTPKMPPPALPPMPPTSAMRRQQRGVVAETIGSFVNESGDRIWICPSCTMQDDGSPMVGCDICDDWYHWVCVGIKEEPSEDVWYCPKCKPTKNAQKKRGRKKKK